MRKKNRLVFTEGGMSGTQAGKPHTHHGTFSGDCEITEIGDTSAGDIMRHTVSFPKLRMPQRKTPRKAGLVVGAITLYKPNRPRNPAIRVTIRAISLCPR
jgi:hypothetical protein